MSIVAVVGSRDYANLDKVREFVEGLPPETVVISGGALGVDWVAAETARRRGLRLDIFRADWPKHGRAAGPIRNSLIVKAADRIVAFWNGKSRGTMDVLEKARAAGKPIEEISE